jgi:hypothetical protein
MHARNDLVGLVRAILDGDLLAVPPLLDWLRETGDDRLHDLRRLMCHLAKDSKQMAELLRDETIGQNESSYAKYRPWRRFADGFSTAFAYELLENEDGRALHRLMENAGSVEHAIIWNAGGLPEPSQAMDSYDEVGGEMMAGEGIDRDLLGQFRSSILSHLRVSGDNVANDGSSPIMPDYPREASGRFEERTLTHQSLRECLGLPILPDNSGDQP